MLDAPASKSKYGQSYQLPEVGGIILVKLEVLENPTSV